MLEKFLKFFKKNKENVFSELNIEKREKIIKQIEELIGKRPQDEKYFLKAFTHRSYLEKTKEEIKSNERLEFLGDAILGKVVAEYLFQEYPTEKEGFLTKARSHLVNKHSLEKIGYKLKLNELILINEKYLANERKKLSNIIADCVEALIAAIYLDMGEETTKIFIYKNVITPQVLNGDIDYDNNYKGQLLEYSHANKLNQPVYSVVEQIGPQHEKTYKVEVSIDLNNKGMGCGPNKKLAEQNAAKELLSILKNKT